MSRKELIVYGYARRIEKSFSICIPVDILLVLCFVFRDIDSWNEQYTNSKFEIADKYLTLRTGYYRHSFFHAFGDCVVNKGQYHHWILKVHSKVQYLYVGIIKNDESLLEKTGNEEYSWMYNYRSADKGLLFNCGNANVRHWIDHENKYQYTKYGKECGKNGDVIEMIVDLRESNGDIGSIKYIVNGEHYGIAYDKLPAVSYRLAVCFSSPKLDSKIEML